MDQDDTLLRARARAFIQTGKLPRSRPERTWGGRGSSASCTLCGSSVSRDELEVEIERPFDGEGAAGGNYHFHLRCFAAWEHECRDLELESSSLVAAN